MSGAPCTVLDARLRQSAAQILVPGTRGPRVDDLQYDIISGVQSGDDRLEVLHVVNRVFVDGGDHPTLELGDVDLIREGSRLNRLNEHAVQSGRCALGQIADRDPQLGWSGIR